MNNHSEDISKKYQKDSFYHLFWEQQASIQSFKIPPHNDDGIP